MKKLISTALALALVGGSTTAALAHGRPGYGPPVHRGYVAKPYGYGYGYGYGSYYEEEHPPKTVFERSLSALDIRKWFKKNNN